MTDFLFIPTQSANGGRIRVRFNDLPRLFAEGIEEPAIRAPSARERLRKTVSAAVGGMDLTRAWQWASSASKHAMLEARNIKPICAASQGRESQAQA
jgi:hypothetical protein